MNFEVPLERRVLIALDFDDTVSTEYMEAPLFQDNWDKVVKKYGHLGVKLETPIDYFNIIPHTQPGVSRGIGYLQQMLWDRDDVFEGQLTVDHFKEIGARVPMAPGVPEGLLHLQEFWKKEGVDVRYCIISVGIKEIVDGTVIAPLMTEVFASEFLYNSQGIAHGIKDAKTPFDKSRGIIEIVKGGGNKELDTRRSHSQYQFDYRNSMFVGDAFSDVSGFAYSREKGAICFAVYDPGDIKKFNNLMDAIPTRVHYIVPRDYRQGSDTMRAISRVVRLMIERTCSFNPPILHEFRRGRITDPKLSNLIHDHIDSCRYCDSVSSLRWIEPK